MKKKGALPFIMWLDDFEVNKGSVPFKQNVPFKRGD